jgi:hypothetical protein
LIPAKEMDEKSKKSIEKLLTRFFYSVSTPMRKMMQVRSK